MSRVSPTCRVPVSDAVTVCGCFDSMLEEMNKMNDENASLREERNAFAARIQHDEAARTGRSVARSASAAKQVYSCLNVWSIEYTRKRTCCNPATLTGKAKRPAHAPE